MKLIDGDKLYDALADKLSWLMGYDDGETYLAVGACIRDEIESQPEGAERMKWIPISEQLPEDESYILVSFENATMLDIARYEENDEGSTFYPGDDEKSYSSYGIFVNAWMPLTEPYREEQ